MAYSDFLAAVDRREVSDVIVAEDRIQGHYTDGRTFISFLPAGADVVTRVEDKGVRISGVAGKSDSPTFFSVLAFITLWGMATEPLLGLRSAFAAFRILQVVVVVLLVTCAVSKDRRVHAVATVLMMLLLSALMFDVRGTQEPPGA